MVEPHEAKRRTNFCDNCLYWVNSTDKLVTGECRRNAPSPKTGWYESYWPMTCYDDWCGEHEPMLEPTK